MNAPRFPERWVGLYTRGLPSETRVARRDEIASDVYEQCASDAHATERGVRASVVGRTLRGVPGDVMWRFEEGRVMKQQRASSDQPTGLRAAWATLTQAWFTPVAALVGVFDLMFALAVVFDSSSTMPGRAIGPVVLVGLAIAMFAGLWLRWRSEVRSSISDGSAGRRVSPRSVGLVFLSIVAVVAIAFGVVGSLIALVTGVLLLVVAVLMAARRDRKEMVVETASAPRASSSAASSSRSVVFADVLIVVGTLPALAMFWMVIPAIMAIVVIAGVIGTGSQARREVVV